MTMRGRNPFEEIEQFFERMSRQFEGGANLPTGMLGDAPVDVADRGDEYEVTVDLPGFEKEDIQVRLTDDTLRISAVRETGTETAGGPEAETEMETEPVNYVRRERRRESVDRTVTLPDAVDEESVDATLSNGVLTITLAKRVAGEDAKTIDIE